MAISYKKLACYLKQGREIEFYLNNKKYSFSNNQDGWYITEYDNPDYQSFANTEELLANGTINGRPIKEVWKDVVIDILF